MKRTPREHQLHARQLLRIAHRNGKRRPMLQIATGGGKTFVAAMIITGARQHGKRVLFIVDALSLIDQTVEAFIAEGIHDIGVIQADHPMTDWTRTVQVGSVQTLSKRGMPAVDLVIVDEAHTQYKWLTEIMTKPEWADVPFLGLSATPWSKGLGNIYDDLIIPITMQELMDQGLLCPFRVFAAAHPDLTGVKTKATAYGPDYDQGQLADIMGDAVLVANIVETWKKQGEGRPTLVFCVDRAHAKKVQLRFQEAGIGCGYIDCNTERAERNAIRKQLDAGEIKVVANVGCLTKGVDWAIGCVILARPTKSEILYVQMVGRGLRVNDGIPDCIILDHADNTLRMGFVTDIHRTELCTAKKGQRQQQQKPEALPNECPSCSFLKPPKTRECTACGFIPTKISDIEEADGDLIQINRGKLKASKAEKQSWLSQLNVIAGERGYKSGWAANTYKKRFGVWPRGLAVYTRETPTQEVRNFVLGMNIRFSKRRAA
jgi:DNA repair protein RadD